MTVRTNQAPGTDTTDAAVFAQARKRLDDCPTVPGTVHVHVESASVTLTGTVGRTSQRTDAGLVVRPVIGGRRLVNNIVVIPAAGAESVEGPAE